VLDSEPEEFEEPILNIGVPMELDPDERRVAVTPNTVKKFRKLRFSVTVESGAGRTAGFRDDDYTAAGATVAARADVWSNADILLKLKKPEAYEEFNELEAMDKLHMLVSYFYPAQNLEHLQTVVEKCNSLSLFAMDCVPRITRA
jgi:NAD/NADP transhydrogenase alpha subunit